VCREFHFRCAYCGITRAEAKARGFDLQVDHLVPVTDPGCIHGITNAVPACIHCNASKGNKDLIEWAAAKDLVHSLAPLAVAKYHRLRGIYAA
jgi:5-methylcytosine-specific restriction endonuclease McrA